MYYKILQNFWYDVRDICWYCMDSVTCQLIWCLFRTDPWLKWAKKRKDKPAKEKKTKNKKSVRRKKERNDDGTGDDDDDDDEFDNIDKECDQALETARRKAEAAAATSVCKFFTGVFFMN